MKLFAPVDYFLDRITMYKLIQYGLIVLLLFATLFSFLGIIDFPFYTILFSTLFLVIISLAANILFSWGFDAPTNVESAYITALILALIVNPAQSGGDYINLFWVGVLAMSSKYILAINKKHLFNPAAISVVITGLALNYQASWWVGTASLAPFVALLGFLIIRKLRFQDMAWSFFMTTIFISLFLTVTKGINILSTLEQITLQSFVLFLGSVMLTEPLTLPPTKNKQIIYGALVGLLSDPQINFFGFFLSPEQALVLGNIFAYLVSPKEKLILLLQNKIQEGEGIIDFIFKPNKKLAYLPGQYMEWTLPHENPDFRGNRRYFTLASSPTEDTLRLGIKFYENGSSYKKALQKLEHKTPIVAGQLAGDFTLPKDKEKKLAFIAGGIGITPYRSILKYLIDKKEQRDIVLLYSNKKKEEIVYKDTFDEAEESLGIKTVYTLTDKNAVSDSWDGEVGRIDSEMIKKQIPDFKERLFYISGPQSQIDAIKNVLSLLGVQGSNIKTDYFPGLV